MEFTPEVRLLDLRSRIDPGTKIEDSIIMGSDFFETFKELKYNEKNNIPHIGIGENSTIRRAIIDKNVRIGKNVQLVNYENIENMDAENYVIRDGIILIPKNSIIADGTKI